MAQTPGMDTPIDTTKKCGWYHADALDEEDATRPLQAPFVATMTQWEGALDQVDATTKASMKPRVKVRFAEARLEEAIDALYNDCKKKGNEAALGAVFKDGKQAETKPRGDSQRKRTEDVLLPRVRALPESSPLRAEHLPAIEGALTGLVAAIGARRDAALAAAQAQANENMAREDLVTAFRSNLGGIQELYPRSAALRDRFFLSFRESRSDDGGGGGGPTS